MADDSHGMPHTSLLLPNGLSFLRLALAPLTLMPFLGLPVHSMIGAAFAVFLVAISLTDVLDGWIARRQKVCTRLGRMLDTLADLAFLTFLGVALYRVDAIPGSLLWLIVVRYPLMLVGVTVLYFAKGPAPLSPTIIGKVTTFATNVVLLVIALTLLVETDWPPLLWIDRSVWCLEILIGANILFLIYSGVVWTGSTKTANDASSH
jgi:phosphatidylglycerophosphate synthase